MGIPTLITTTTASGDSDVAFTNITSAYDEYMWVLTDINPGTNATALWINFSDDTSSHSYDLTKTSTFFSAMHRENDSETGLVYVAGFDIAQGTGYIRLGHDDTGSGADESFAGILHLFNPASTTYVKHFYGRGNNYHHDNYVEDGFIAGYINTTAAVTAINFQPDQGVFDGVIQMYGIS